MSNIIDRPQGHLHRMPINIRWEATRRHPYYLVFWEDAKRFYERDLGDEAESIFRYIASLILGAIGVARDPVDPATSAVELLTTDVDPAWMRGSVQPLTFRGILVMLLANLPPAERSVIGALFTAAGSQNYSVADDDEHGSLQTRQAIARLATIRSDALDSFPVAPLYFIHMEAAQRVIMDDLRSILHFWNQQNQHGRQTRLHVDKIQSYLDVWDRREGWTGSGYDIRREQTLAAIARELKEPASTIASRYYSAFEVITGREFTPRLWKQLVAPLKLSETLGDAAAILNAPMRRQMESPVRRPIPDSVVTHDSSDARGSVVDRGATTHDATQAIDWLLDLEDLLAAGRTDEEIQQQLELPDLSAVAYLRDRLAEFRAES